TPSLALQLNPVGPISVVPVWSNDVTPKASSIRDRIAGIDAPGSPAWIETRSADRERSTPSSRATSARRSAYVGVHTRTVAWVAMSASSRSLEDIAPPEIARAPRCSAPAKADQNPTNGPKEKQKNRRSPAVTPAAR